MTLGRPKTKKIWEQFHSVRVPLRWLRFVLQYQIYNFIVKESSKHVMLQEISIFLNVTFSHFTLGRATNKLDIMNKIKHNYTFKKKKKKTYR